MKSQESDAEENKPRNKLDADRTFAGPVSERKSTDCLWLLLILAHWALVTFIGLAAFGWFDSSLRQGRPRILTNWMDHNGYICGSGTHGGAVDSKPFVYFPNPSGRIYEDIDDYPLESSDDIFKTLSGPHKGKVPSSLYAVCLKSCPASNHGTVVDGTACEDGDCDTWDSYKTVRLAYYCLPHVGSLKLADGALQDSSDTLYNWCQNVFGDVLAARVPIAVSGSVVALGAGFTYLMLIRLPGVLSCLVWGSIGIILLALVAVGTLLWQNYQNLKDVDDDGLDSRNKFYKSASLGLALAFYAAAALFLCFVCCMRKAIWLAIGVIRESARAVGDMLAIVLVPFVQGLAMVVFVIPTFAYSVFISTAGRKKLDEYDDFGAQLPMPYYTYQTTNSQLKALLYIAFSTFWTFEFVAALGQLCIATAAATWYFTRDKRHISSATVFRAAGHALRYHAGTAAFGSLVVAVVRFIKLILLYVQKQVESAVKGRSLTVQRIVRCVFCAVQCCLWCLDKCLKFINKNAYVQTAIFGYPFCKAARKGFYLVARNLRRIAAIEAIGNFVFFIGQLMIAAVSGLFCLSWMRAYYRDETTDVVWPSLFATFLAWHIGGAFVGVVDMVSDTVLVCFCADEEIFGLSSPESYATPGLRKFVSNSNKAKAKQMEAQGPGHDFAPSKGVY